jgi:hypothetical protein
LRKNEEWLKELGNNSKSNDNFEKLGDPICDGLRLPECPLVFGYGKERFSEIKKWLASFKVPVESVCQA